MVPELLLPLASCCLWKRDFISRGLMNCHLIHKFITTSGQDRQRKYHFATRRNDIYFIVIIYDSLFAETVMMHLTHRECFVTKGNPGWSCKCLVLIPVHYMHDIYLLFATLHHVLCVNGYGHRKNKIQQKYKIYGLLYFSDLYPFSFVLLIMN